MKMWPALLLAMVISSSSAVHLPRVLSDAGGANRLQPRSDSIDQRTLKANNTAAHSFLQVKQDQEGCGPRVANCQDACPDSDDEKAACYALCAQDPATAYFDIAIPVAEADIDATCTDYCSHSDSTCYEVCRKGYDQHYLPYIGHYNLMCKTPNDYRDAAPIASTTPSGTPAVINKDTSTCVDQTKDCLETCKIHGEKTIARATCSTQCVHAAAVGYFDYGIVPATKRAKRDCGSDTNKCYAKHTVKFFPDEDECNAIKSVEFPYSAVSSNCDIWCKHFFGNVEKPVDNCNSACQRAYDKTKRMGNVTSCLGLCGPQGVGADDEERAFTDGCWEGCFKYE